MPSANGRCDRPRLAWDWLPLVAGLVVTFVMSSIPGHRLPPLGEWNTDKLLHGLEFALVGALFLRVLRRTPWGGRAVVAVLLAALMASTWGALDEVHQLFTPNRSPDWRDWVADTLGGLLGSLAYLAAVRGRAAWLTRPAAPNPSEPAS